MSAHDGVLVVERHHPVLLAADGVGGLGGFLLTVGLAASAGDTSAVAKAATSPMRVRDVVMLVASCSPGSARVVTDRWSCDRMWPR